MGATASKTASSPLVNHPPVSPDSVINTWELMDGLDDESYEFVRIEEYVEEDWVIPLSIRPTQARPITTDKVVLYFTTVRGIRKTYEDCCRVRTILKGIQVNVDECDISMDVKYRKDLQSLLGEEAKKLVCLPQVFIRGIHIGGVEEVMQLNDSGELAEMLRGFPACERVGICGSCGDARFVPCSNCDGSTKVFEEQCEGFLRCLKCNENGLVRCRECCP